MFWKALWSNDHAVAFLVEKHLKAAKLKHKESTPKWLKFLFGCLMLCVVAIAVTFVYVAIQQRDFGFALAPFAVCFFYYFMFRGVYEVWQCGSLLSHLKEGRTLATVLTTGVPTSEVVDVTAAVCTRSAFKFLLLPTMTVFSFMALFADGSREDPSVLAFVVIIMLFYLAIGVYASLMLHGGSPHKGARGLGGGLAKLLACIYLPAFGLAVLAALLAPLSGLFGLLAAIWYLGLPWTFRRIVIRNLEKSVGVEHDAKPTKTSGIWSSKLADLNPILARSFKGQSWGSVIMMSLGLFCWVSVANNANPGGSYEIVTAMHISLGFGLWVAVNVYQELKSLKDTGALDELRTTPLPAKSVVDGWVAGAAWLPTVALLGLLLWFAPLQQLTQTVFFGLAVTGAFAYSGALTGLDAKSIPALGVLGALLAGCWFYFTLQGQLLWQLLVVATLLASTKLLRDRASDLYSQE